MRTKHALSRLKPCTATQPGTGPATVGSVVSARRLARRSLKPQLNQIRTWVRQGRTDAWIAHQLEVSVGRHPRFKREHELVPGEAGDAEGFGAGAARPRSSTCAPRTTRWWPPRSRPSEEESTRTRTSRRRTTARTATTRTATSRKRRRRGRRGGRGRTRRKQQALEGTFDHGDEGYGLWLDPAIQDDPVYAEHWAGHRPVTVTVEAERIVISRAGEERTATTRTTTSPGQGLDVPLHS